MAGANISPLRGLRAGVAFRANEPYLGPMAEITIRLSTALADRYRIERHLREDLVQNFL